MAAPPDRLRPLDEAFLTLERPDAPMSVGFVATLDGGPLHDGDGGLRVGAIRAHVASRLHLLPRLRRRLRPVPFGLTPPLWVDDCAFDITNHVRFTRLAPPGGDDQLFALAAALHQQPLDRARPLWEVWFVDGLGDGRVGVVEKIHHALVDGVSDVDVVAVLLDVTADVPPVEAPAWRPAPPPPMIRLVADGVAHRVADPLVTVRQVRRLAATLGGIRTFLTPATVAPSSTLNRRIGGERTFAVVRHDLAALGELRLRLGGTLNDLALAAVTGGLRRLLLSRGEPCDRLQLKALVPVSIRPDHHRGTLGNQVSAMFAPLPVCEPDPLMRLRIIQSSLRDLKQRRQADATGVLLELAEAGPPPLVAAATRLVHRQPFVNVVVTNVPGPPVPLYLLGARMLEAFPVVPLAHNLDVSIGVLSCDGALTMGLLADTLTCGDVDELAHAIAASFDELAVVAAGVSGRAPAPRRDPPPDSDAADPARAPRPRRSPHRRTPDRGATTAPR